MLIAVPCDLTAHQIAEFKGFWDAGRVLHAARFLQRQQDPQRRGDGARQRGRDVNLASDAPNRLLARQQIAGLRKKVEALKLKMEPANQTRP